MMCMWGCIRPFPGRGPRSSFRCLGRLRVCVPLKHDSMVGSSQVLFYSFVPNGATLGRRLVGRTWCCVEGLPWLLFFFAGVGIPRVV